MPQDDRPLAGVRVLDLTRFPPGQYCTVLLVDLGADVCRLDPPGSNPGSVGVGVGLSRGKRSVSVDLRNPGGPEVLRRLAGWADVLVENSRPGDMDERGFGYRHAAEEYPSLIWCSITGWGQDGPYARWPGHDLTYTAHSGLLSALEPELPWHPRAMLAVPLGAVMAATAIASALFERTRTGRGRHLDVSLAESATWLLAGNDSQINPPTWGVPVTPDRRMYLCSDGRYVTVAAQEPRTWTALCSGLGLDDLAQIRPVGDEVARVEDLFAQAFATRPASEWVSELGPAGAAISAVNSGTDLLDDPQVQARGSLLTIAGVTVPASPIRIRDAAGAAPSPPAAPPATIGADTDEILAEAGYSAEEISALKASGAVSGPAT